MSAKPVCTVPPHSPGRPLNPRVRPGALAAARRPDTSLDPCVPRALPARPLNTLRPTRTPRPLPLPPSQGPGGDQRVEFLGGPGPWPPVCVLAVPPTSVPRPPGSSADAGDRWGGVWLPQTPGTALSAQARPAGHCCLECRTVSNNFVVCKAQGCLQNNLQSNLQFVTPSTG